MGFIFCLCSGCMLTRENVKQAKRSNRSSVENFSADSSNNYYPQRSLNLISKDVIEKQEQPAAALENQPADVSMRLSQLENYLRELRGQVEVLDKVQKDQAFLIQTLDSRLTSLSKKDEMLEASKDSSQLTKEESFKQAEIFFQKHQWKSAIVYYEQYRKDNKKGSLYKKATFQIGLCFKKLKMKKEMRVFFQELIDLFPKSAEAKKARKWLKKK